MKKIIGFLLAAALALPALFVSACGAGDEEVIISKAMGDDEVFEIDGEKCRLPAIKLLLLSEMNLHGESFGISVLHNEDLRVQKKYGQYIKQLTLDGASRVYCMAALAKSRGIALSDEQEEMVRLAAEDCCGSLSEAELGALDIAREDVEDLYRRYALADKLYRTLIKDVNEEVSDDEARVLEARQIYTADEAKAREALAELEEKDDFSSVAANYNEADEIAVTLQRGQLPEAAEEVVFSMQDGEMSDVVRTDQGFYIFYCDNKFNEELTEEHKADIVEQRKKEAFETAYVPFRDRVFSRLNEAAWEQAQVQELEQFSFDGFYRIYEKYLGDAVWDDI